MCALLFVSCSLRFLMLFLYGLACPVWTFFLCFALHVFLMAALHLDRWTLCYWLVCLTRCMRMYVSIAMYIVYRRGARGLCFLGLGIHQLFSPCLTGTVIILRSCHISF